MIKSAAQILSENYPGLSFLYSEHIINAMKEHTTQFLDLAAEEAKVHQHSRDFNTSVKAKIIRQKVMISEVDKESILKLKELL